MTTSTQPAFEALLLRLTHPERIVRLRAAQETARLLYRLEHRNWFLHWLTGVRLETDLATGLLIVSLSSLPPNTFDLGALRRQLLHQSVLSETVFMQHFPDVPLGVVTWMNCHSSDASADFDTPDDFESTVSQAGPYLLNSLRRFRQGDALTRHWAWELTFLKEMGYPTSFSTRGFLKGGREDSAAVEPLATDVIRSAFLRTLSFAVSKWGMPESLAQDLGVSCVPFLVDLARICFGSAPPGWGGTNMNQERLQDYLTEITRPNGEQILVAAEGHWSSSEDQKIARVSIRSAIIPADRQGALDTEWLRGLFRVASFSAGRLSISGAMDERPSDVVAKGAPAFPICVRPMPEAAPRWQLDFLLNAFFWPLSPLNQFVTAECFKDGVKFSIDGTVIGTWRYWLRDWKPGYMHSIGPRLGGSLEINRRTLGDWLAKTARVLVVVGYADVHHKVRISDDYSHTSYQAVLALNERALLGAG